MASAEKKIVTIKDVAERARLSVAAVSYALRDNPKVSPETRARVQAIAAAVGYRPNPRVASLMSHIRRSQLRDAGEHIAFVWMHTTKAQAAGDPFLRKVIAGARGRAEQVGFALEEFWTSERGMTERRLAQIIQARGIVGVVLSPVTTNEPAVTLDWNWGPFAAAVIGNVTWTPELHHAGHHHYLAMQMVLRELGQLGCARPVALIEPESNERAKRAWEAAFLTHHPQRGRAGECVRVLQRPAKEGAAGGGRSEGGAGGGGELGKWIRARKPDALIVSATRLLQEPGVKAAVRELGLPVVTLYWSESDGVAGIGGVDQCYDRIAAHAVDLVVTQLNNNEYGAPDLPRMMLFPGRWMAPGMPGRRG